MFCTCNNLGLNVISRPTAGEILKRSLLSFESPVVRVQVVAAHEVEGRNHSVNWFANHSNISSWLRKDLVQAKWHMALKHAKPL